MKQLKENHCSCNVHISLGVTFAGNLKYISIYLFNLCPFLYLVHTCIRRMKPFEDCVWKGLSIILFHRWQQLQKETKQKELCL